MTAWVNAYVDGDHVVLVRREEDGSVSETRELAEYVSYHERAKLPADIVEAISVTDAVLSVKDEAGKWMRVSWRRPFSKGKSGWKHDSRRIMMSDEDSPFVARKIRTYEGDVDPVLRRMVDTGDAIQRPRRVYFDIETDSRVPFSRKEDMRVLCWSMYDDEENLVAEGMLNEDTDADEKRLLVEFWRALLPYDQACAWNGAGFDEVVIFARSEQRKLDVEPRRVLFCDQLMVHKRMNVTASESGEEKVSLRLQDVSTSLGLAGKDPFDASKTWEAWSDPTPCTDHKCVGCGENHEHSSRECMMRYNRKDTRLLPQIEKKTGYLDLFFSLCEACGVFPDSQSTNPSLQVDSFMLRLGKSKGEHFPTRKHIEQESQFRGAFVMEPTFRGLVRGIHVCDFARLYPSIILTWNMSPETLVGRVGDDGIVTMSDDWADAHSMPRGTRVQMRRDEWAIAPRTRAVFDQTRKGVLVEALETMIALRSKWNDAKAKATPGTAEWVEADRRSTAYKIAANSFFGVVSSVISRYFSSIVGESITQSGVELLLAVIEYLRSLGYDVGYGDTDSGFAGGCTADEFRAAVKHLNDVVLPEFVRRHGARRNDVKLAYEKEFRLVVFVGKKRYAGRFEHYKGSPAMVRSKPEVKGLEFKRGDTARPARVFQEAVIRKLLGDWECDTCRGADLGKHDCSTPELHAHPCADPIAFEEMIEFEQRHILQGPLLRTDYMVSKTITKKLPPSEAEVAEHLAQWRERCAKQGMEVDAAAARVEEDRFVSRRVGPDGYKVRRKDDGSPFAMPPHIQVAMILRDRGEEVQGAKIAFAVVDGSASPMKIAPAVDLPARDVTPASAPREPGDAPRVDRYYLWENLVWPPTERLLQAAFPDHDWTRWGKVRPKKPRKPPVRRPKGALPPPAPSDPPGTPPKALPTPSLPAGAPVPTSVRTDVGGIPRVPRARKPRAAPPTPLAEVTGRLAVDGIGVSTCNVDPKMDEASAKALEGVARAAAAMLTDAPARPEEWRSVVGFDGYEVSDLGRVRSYRQTGNGSESRLATPREMKPQSAKRGGYAMIILRRDKKSIIRPVHQLVLEAFVGPCPDGQEARHVNDPDPMNNRLDNLAWGTHEENIADQARHGTDTRGERNGGAKLTQEEADVIRASGEEGKTLAEKYGVSSATISRVRHDTRYVQTTAHARPFLKWVGGKRQLVPEILARLPQGMGGELPADARWSTTYHEPFVGGGAVFFALVADGRLDPRRAVLSDANLELVTTYRAIRDDVESVIEALKQHRNEREHFDRVRAQDWKTMAWTEVAARMIFLNKTCFNGLYRVNGSGQFNTPFGSFKNPTICDEENLRACSRVLAHARIEHRPFDVALTGEMMADPHGAIVYCDPPYWPASGTANFTAYQADGFGPDKQELLRDVARRLALAGAYVLVSNNDVPDVRRLYDGWRVDRVMATRMVNRDADGRGKVPEVLATPSDASRATGWIVEEPPRPRGRRASVENVVDAPADPPRKGRRASVENVVDEMRPEYDFSDGERGKYARVVSAMRAPDDPVFVPTLGGIVRMSKIRQAVVDHPGPIDMWVEIVDGVQRVAVPVGRVSDEGLRVVREIAGVVG